MIILTELVVILSLSGWFVSEYVNNVYFQNYVNGLSPIIIPLASVGFGIVSASAATALYLRMKNLTRISETTADEESKHRGQRRAARNVSSGDQGPERSLSASTLAGAAAKLRPIGVGPNQSTSEPATPVVGKKEKD